MIHIRIRLGRLARQYHNQAPSQRFNILYFGRDEFSCQVLQKLYRATGMTFLRPFQLEIDTSSPTDVWQNLLIATQPDQMIGRKRDILSVRQSPLHSLPPASPASFSFKRVSSSIENPRRQTQTASDHHSTNQVRAQNVDGTSAFLFSYLALREINPLSPPSPRRPSIPWLTAFRLHPITSCSLHHSDASSPSAFSRFLDRRTPSMYTHPLYQPTAALRPSSGPS